VAGRLLNALLVVHSGLFRAGLLISAIVAGWGLYMYVRRLSPTSGFRSTLVLTEGLFIVQGLLGIAIFLGGRRPHDNLHWLYGVLLVIVLPIALSYTSGRNDRQQSLVFGLAGLFMVGLAIRALTTA
jgi:heme A synthase